MPSNPSSNKNAGTDTDRGSQDFSEAIDPVPAVPVLINYGNFAAKAGSAEINWAELDTGSQAAYLRSKEREALIWLNLMRTRPYLFTNMMKNDGSSETPGISIADSSLIDAQYPEWKLAANKALHLAARELAVQLACSDSWDTNKYVKGFSLARYIDSGSAGNFYVFDGNSPEAFISKFQMNSSRFNADRPLSGRGPGPLEANMAAVAVEGTFCVIAFGKDIINKDKLPDSIAAGNDEKLYYQYAGDATFADLQRNESFGITWKDISRIFDIRDILKNKAAEIVGDAAGERQKTERILRWMIDSFDYDYTYVSNGGNALGILEALDRPADDPGHNHLIICAEYARLMTALCRAAGLEARYIEGLAASTGSNAWRGHAWVQILIDGQWHMSDPTWNDTGVQNGALYLFPGAVNGDEKHFLQF